MSIETPYAIGIDIATQYLDEESAPDQSRYVFAYTIRIENRGSQPARLLNRHWVVTDEDGHVEEVHGEGVVGEQPLLQPGQSHDYVSGCPLTTPFGSMEGFYTFERGDGSPAEVRIPFGQVIERGMLRPGEELFSIGNRHKAKVRADGSLIGNDVKGSIHQVGAALEGAPSCNGWTYWHFRREGKMIPLDILRQQIRAEMEGDAPRPN